MSSFATAALATAMIAAFLLIAGGIRLLLRREDRTRGVLMLLAAAVMIGNVLIWTL